MNSMYLNRYPHPPCAVREDLYDLGEDCISQATEKTVSEVFMQTRAAMANDLQSYTNFLLTVWEHYFLFFLNGHSEAKV